MQEPCHLTGDAFEHSDGFDVVGLWEHVYHSRRSERVVIRENADIASERTWIAGDVDHARHAPLRYLGQQVWAAAGAWRVEQHQVGPVTLRETTKQALGPAPVELH